MKQPNILMYHRIEIDNANLFNDLYYRRNMVVSLQNLFETIDNFLQNGFKFGNIETCLKSEKYFHLSFDDGFKEHLEIAKILKQKYSVDYDCITFSINVGNSYFQNFSGMDLIYSIFQHNTQEKLLYFLNFEATNDFQTIKNKVFSLQKKKILELSNQFLELQPSLQNIFLNENEIKELSNIFSIASHGITHRFLTFDIENSKYEIQQSKEFLESELNRKIDVFCYPEGKTIQLYTNSVKLLVTNTHYQ